jgi:Na+-translocating ferredoxin:NAD+ oxidoreductase RnfD subunit
MPPMSSLKRRERREGTPRPLEQPFEAPPARSLGPLAVPMAFTAAMLALTFLPRLQVSEHLLWSFWGTGAVLLGWLAILAVRGQVSGIHFSQPRPQHYIQACCHLTVYAFWGYYWRPVYDFAPLLVGQLLFAYAFDMLLSWSRRESYPLGFGPFPIIFSTNLFLWFKDDWFAWQFLLIAVGFAGKAFVRWERDGKRVHIFNPSAFTLAIFAVVLLATGTTNLTWGQEIASTFGLGPHIYKVVFVVGLVVMYFFSITPVTAVAAATLFVGSMLYTAVTGVPYFVDSDIPSAVFLGLHLLVTDPSTSPRTPLGRAIFGLLYGLGVFGLYALLGALGMPTFYDKLMAVPLLNLAVPAIDRFVRNLGARPWIHTLGLDPPLGRANLAHMAVWIVFFGVMTAAGGGDGMHKGDSLPFWQQACAADKPQACARLLRIEASYCGDNTAWACNELGLHYTEGALVPADPDRAFLYFSRACEARFQPACLNLLEPASLTRANPRPFDLRLLVREGGPNLIDMPVPDLYARACKHGWEFACR